jgi:hypothetical protein
MKGAIPLLVLSNLVVAPIAIATDVKEVLRDHLAFCSQFVIQDPDPSIVLDYMHNCCALSQNVHDCHMYDSPRIER